MRSAIFIAGVPWTAQLAVINIGFDLYNNSFDRFQSKLHARTDMDVGPLFMVKVPRQLCLKAGVRPSQPGPLSLHEQSQYGLAVALELAAADAGNRR